MIVSGTSGVKLLIKSNNRRLISELVVAVELRTLTQYVSLIVDFFLMRVMCVKGVSILLVHLMK